MKKERVQRYPVSIKEKTGMLFVCSCTQDVAHLLASLHPLPYTLSFLLLERKGCLPHPICPESHSITSSRALLLLLPYYFELAKFSLLMYYSNKYTNTLLSFHLKKHSFGYHISLLQCFKV